MRKKIGRYTIHNTNKDKKLIDDGDVWLTTHEKGMIMSITLPIHYTHRSYTDELRFSLGSLLKRLQKEFEHTTKRSGGYYNQVYINIRFLAEDINKMNKALEKTFTVYPRGYNELKDEFTKYKFTMKLDKSIKDAYNEALLDRL